MGAQQIILPQPPTSSKPWQLNNHAQMKILAKMFLIQKVKETLKNNKVTEI